MSDIALIWNDALGSADLAVDANDLLRDGGLETAVFLSLFTDRRAEDGDVLPDGETDRRGWWGDSVPVAPGDRIGSRLWLLARSKQVSDVQARAPQYAREALQWLIDDRVADRVDVESEIVGNGVLVISVTVHRPKSDPAEFRFNYNWAAQEVRR